MAGNREFPFKDISAWVQWPADLTRPLDRDLQADVAIIGGGLTGLHTALQLREQGADVVVLEQKFSGYGASGRAAGFLSPGLTKDLPLLRRIWGPEHAAALVHLANESIATTVRLIQQYDIDCELVTRGNLIVALHPPQGGRLRKIAEVGRALGAQVRFVSVSEAKERGIPEGFRGGVLEENGAHLHPGRYVMGVRRAALAAGVRLFEQTAVTRIDSGTKVRVHTEGGCVTADKAVLATSAFTPALGWLRRRVVPIQGWIFETEPLSDDHLSRIGGWKGGEGLYTAHELLETYRLTPRNTLVGGGKRIDYRYGSQQPRGYRPDVFRVLEKFFRERLPKWNDVGIAHFWGGTMAYTVDFNPALGAADDLGNVLYGVAYAANGLPQTSMIGAFLAEMVQGREHPVASALKRGGWNWPPEPLRWAICKLFASLLRAGDAVADRKVRRFRGPP